ILAVIVADSVAVFSVYLYEKITLKASQNALTYGRANGPFVWKFEAEGILRPPTVKADDAVLADDEEVIGVVVDGRARAYRLEALRRPPFHIVNDLVAG